MLEELKKFLAESNKAGYGAGESVERKWIKESDGSTTIAYVSVDGAWRFHDNFFGGEPYGGREVIFKNDQAVWLMVYYGEITDRELDKKEVYDFLRAALMKAPDDLPVRGPAEFKKEEGGKVWEYQNKWAGDLNRFKGREIILLDGREIFNTDYSGGWVDVPKEA
ncbi:MAG: DUF5680 domain-containing protein [Candidatus Paceibacterota bacterium]|jgi:hypothetical protein